MPVAREVLAGLCALLLGACAPHSEPGSDPAAAYQQESFQSGGRPVTVDWYPATGPSQARHPAVLILHGSEGFSTGGTDYAEAARQLSTAGYQAFVVHYFDRTGDSFVLRRSTIRSRLPLWQGTVRDALTHVAAHHGVDAARIGVLGASLGGGLAVLSARNEPRIRAIVDYFGFYPDDLTPADRLPPILLLHGGADHVLPVTEHGRRLHEFLDQQHSPNELVVYPGAGHGFRNEPTTRADAARRAKAFFARYLGA